jgi:mono/diheme cytochrome c family protein
VRRILCLVAATCALVLPGCERAMQNMYDQPRYKPLRPSPLFADGNSSRPLPPGTVVHSSGPFAGTSSGRVGVEDALARDAAYAAQHPGPITSGLLQRGRDRYTIYCEPCHSPLGDGDGRIVRRGFPSPPSYHIDRLRDAPDRHFFDVMTQGYGIMYSYADRLDPRDRWAVVAYIRALQRSQQAKLADVPPEAREELEEAPR